MALTDNMRRALGEALASLPRGSGKQRSADEIKKALDAEVARLRAQRDLSPEGLKRRIAQAYVRASTEMQEAKAAASAGREARYDELHRKMFGNPTAGDPQSAINFRDCQERAAQVKNAREAAALLKRAHQTGDEALGKAVAMKALEMAPMGGGWVSLINEWAELNGVDAELTEISELTSGGAMKSLQRGWEHSLSVPPELGSGAHAREWAAEADTADEGGSGDAA